MEYAAFRLLAGLLRWMPYRAGLALAWAVARATHRTGRKRRIEARRRIREVFGPALPERRVRRIAWISWRNLCFNAVEIARLPRMNARWVERRHDAAELRRLRAAIPEGRGTVLALPHAGNWEAAGVVSHRLGIPVFYIARRQRNPLTDAYLNRMRAGTGVEAVLNDRHVLRGVVRHLQAGSCLAILPDVYARRPGLPVPFLGGRANLPRGMALFARLAGAPIQPLFLRREGWTRTRIDLLEPVRPDPAQPREADLLRMTRAVFAQFDRAIRAAPEQYFWYNKRWVLSPPPKPRRASDGARPRERAAD